MTTSDNKLPELTPDQVQLIVSTMERIIRADTRDTVGKIKRTFGLGESDYRTIMDLSMPFIRAKNRGSMWEERYRSFRQRLAVYVSQHKNETISGLDLGRAIHKMTEEARVEATNKSYEEEDDENDLEQ